MYTNKIDIQTRKAGLKQIGELVQLSCENYKRNRVVCIKCYMV